MEKTWWRHGARMVSYSMTFSLSDIPTLFVPDRPILLVDADEVLLQFIKRLEQFFPTKGYELRLTSFQLVGNIYDLETNTPVPPNMIGQLIDTFFDECVDDIPSVDGAAEALLKLSDTYQIAVLSNVPEHCKERRAQSLVNLGMNFPLIANKGNKGPAVKHIASQTKYKTVFVDDLPPQHSSVKDHAHDTHRVHFIADKRLQNMIDKAPAAHHRIDCWQELTAHLKGLNHDKTP